MLVRQRVSRIFFMKKFFDYPISLKYQTFANMGLGRTLKAGFGYLYSSLFKRKENSLEDFYINRFGKPLSRVSVFNMGKKNALQAGVTREISPHTFRHSFATHLIENGADLRVVQEMLGLESILTTEIYTYIDAATWQKSVLSHHPRG